MEWIIIAVLVLGFSISETDRDKNQQELDKTQQEQVNNGR